MWVETAQCPDRPSHSVDSVPTGSVGGYPVISRKMRGFRALTAWNNSGWFPYKESKPLGKPDWKQVHPAALRRAGEQLSSAIQGLGRLFLLSRPDDLDMLASSRSPSGFRCSRQHTLSPSPKTEEREPRRPSLEHHHPGLIDGEGP